VARTFQYCTAAIDKGGVISCNDDRLGDRQEMIYPQIDLSTNATKGKNGSCGAFVGHLPRVESWKAP
jgi:hypothetical protein